MALVFAENHTPGMRKCGIKPAFLHALEVALYLKTMYRALSQPENTIVAALLHDILEDTSVTYRELAEMFGATVAHACELLNKKTPDGKKDMHEYADEMALSELASVVKGADRINNLQSMIGVFSMEKQIAYVAEARNLYVPMLKKARKRFPGQRDVYENIKILMNSQLQLLDALHTRET